MKKLLLTLCALSLMFVACDRGNQNQGLNNRTDDTTFQQEEAGEFETGTDASTDRGTGISPASDEVESNDGLYQESDTQGAGSADQSIQREEEDLGTDRGTGGRGVEAGSDDASGMGMDE